jgi:hypothetical protein
VFEDKAILGTPRTSQRQGHCICILLAAGVTESGQSARGALTRDHSPDDARPGDSCEITEHLGSLDVHLQQGFLHRQDVVGTRLHQLGTMA